MPASTGLRPKTKVQAWLIFQSDEKGLSVVTKVRAWLLAWAFLGRLETKNSNGKQRHMMLASWNNISDRRDSANLENNTNVIKGKADPEQPYLRSKK